MMSLNGTRPFVVDSGATYHMIGETDLTYYERQTMYKFEEPIAMRTADKVLWAYKGVKVFIHELEICVEAVCFPQAPAVLSLGKLVEEEGFDYVWRFTKNPLPTARTP